MLRKEKRVKRKKRIIIEVAVHQMGVQGCLGKGAVVYLISNSRQSEKKLALIYLNKKEKL